MYLVADAQEAIGVFGGVGNYACLCAVGIEDVIVDDVPRVSAERVCVDNVAKLARKLE